MPEGPFLSDRRSFIFGNAQNIIIISMESRDCLSVGLRIFVGAFHVMRNAGKGPLWVDFHIFSF